MAALCYRSSGIPHFIRSSGYLAMFHPCGSTHMLAKATSDISLTVQPIQLSRYNYLNKENLFGLNFLRKCYRIISYVYIFVFIRKDFPTGLYGCRRRAPFHFSSVSRTDCLSCFDATVSYTGTDTILLLFPLYNRFHLFQ